MIEIKPIRSADDYDGALKAIDDLWGAPSGTPQGDQLDILATLVDAYERENFPIETPAPAAVAAFREEQRQSSTLHLVFEIARSRNGTFFFRTKKADDVIFHSSIFATKSEVIEAIRLLRDDVANSEVVDYAA